MNATAIRAGFLTSVQDLGREGFREFGVSVGGALDRHALRVGNLLVGNDESVAGLEITFGGLRLRFMDDRIVAWCGGELEARINSIPVPAGHAAFVRAGEEFTIDTPKAGCYAWLAISGGIDVPIALGSRSTDLRATFGGLNGRALRDGDKVPLGENSMRATSLIARLQNGRVANWKPSHDWSSTAKHTPTLRFVRGVDWHRFKDTTTRLFTNEAFTVSPDSNRMGVRFHRPELRRDENSDLLSEAVAPGTIQVPPGGNPILLLNDCQTIGGYPKIAHVITVDLSSAAQLRAGEQARFQEVSLADAHRLLMDRERDLQQFRQGLRSRFE